MVNVLYMPSVCKLVGVQRDRGGGRGVTELVWALRYKLEGRGSIPDGVIQISIDLILPAALGPWGRLIHYRKGLLGITPGVRPTGAKG
jgi:hypothetical protein